MQRIALRPRLLGPQRRKRVFVDVAAALPRHRLIVRVLRHPQRAAGRRRVASDVGRLVCGGVAVHARKRT